MDFRFDYPVYLVDLVYTRKDRLGNIATESVAIQAKNKDDAGKWLEYQYPDAKEIIIYDAVPLLVEDVE